MSRPTRDRPQVHLTLSPEAIAAIDEVALRWGRTRSQQVEEMARTAAFADGLDIKELGAREAKRRNKFGKLRALEGKYEADGSPKAGADLRPARPRREQAHRSKG
jgi:hypothetical protein